MLAIGKCLNRQGTLLRSAVGIAHVLQSGLVKGYTTSEIDLSSEAQCVSHHLPQLDCHILKKTENVSMSLDMDLRPLETTVKGSE